MLPVDVEPNPPKPAPGAALLLEACALNCRLLMLSIEGVMEGLTRSVYAGDSKLLSQ